MKTSVIKSTILVNKKTTKKNRLRYLEKLLEFCALGELVEIESIDKIDEIISELDVKDGTRMITQFIFVSFWNTY